jgi:hypothetical protein
MQQASPSRHRLIRAEHITPSQVEVPKKRKKKKKEKKKGIKSISRPAVQSEPRDAVDYH